MSIVKVASSVKISLTQTQPIPSKTNYFMGRFSYVDSSYNKRIIQLIGPEI